MSGHKITVSRVVHAEPDAVWAVLTDLDEAPSTIRGITRIKRLEGEGYEVGTRWQETRKMFGKEETQELYVTEVAPPGRTTVEADSAGVHYTTVYTLEPTENSTRLQVTFGASHPDPNLLQRLTWTVFGAVGAKVTTRMLAQDLADIARKAESTS